MAQEEADLYDAMEEEIDSLGHHIPMAEAIVEELEEKVKEMRQSNHLDKIWRDVVAGGLADSWFEGLVTHGLSSRHIIERNIRKLLELRLGPAPKEK